MIPKPLHDFQKQMNWRWIEPNEIVFDVDNRDYGFLAINEIAFNLYKDDYSFEVYFAKGQKSPHLHLWFEKELTNEFKKNFCLKYCPNKYIEGLDISFYDKENSLIAEENKQHFKYKTKKKLVIRYKDGQFNLNPIRIISNENVQQTKISNKLPTTKKIGDGLEIATKLGELSLEISKKLSIINIAKSFGFEFKGTMAKCKFHGDTDPSLSFNDENGLFKCWGRNCEVKGNIIEFVRLCEEHNFKREDNIKWLKSTK